MCSNPGKHLSFSDNQTGELVGYQTRILIIQPSHLLWRPLRRLGSFDELEWPDEISTQDWGCSIAGNVDTNVLMLVPIESIDHEQTSDSLDWSFVKIPQDFC